MNKLSPNTELLLKTFYRGDELIKVRRLLKDECGVEALGCEGWMPLQMERIWFAILKLGQNNPPAMEEAKNLARTDRHDLLINFGFGQDTEAHKKWFQSVIN